jgi:hypothetical protein
MSRPPWVSILREEYETCEELHGPEIALEQTLRVFDRIMSTPGVTGLDSPVEIRIEQELPYTTLHYYTDTPRTWRNKVNGLIRKLADQAYAQMPPLFGPKPAKEKTAKGKRKRKHEGRGKRINEQMMAAFLKDPEARLDWSAAAWADFLGCSKGMVGETETWRMIVYLRTMERDEREELLKRGLGRPE